MGCEDVEMYKKYIKRILDFIAALIMSIVAFPIVVIAGICILITSGGPILFRQKRVGKNEKPFYIYKLRTMAKNKDGVNEVTKLGHILRATSIDELPQLVNILKGEMSFIGPRPWISEYSKYFTKKDKRRLEVLPGLSGWAQVQGRNGITIKQKLKADTWYVDHVSFITDMIILFKTIGIVLKKTGASITEGGIQDELRELEENYNKRLEKEEMKEEKGILAERIG